MHSGNAQVSLGPEATGHVLAPVERPRWWVPCSARQIPLSRAEGRSPPAAESAANTSPSLSVLIGKCLGENHLVQGPLGGLAPTPNLGQVSPGATWRVC